MISPFFKQGNYYAGLDSATNVLMSLTRGEYTADAYMKGNNKQVPSIVFALIILFLFVFINIGRSRKNRVYSPGHALPWWLLLMGAAGSKDSGWGSFNSGGGSFGGGGGGFGGFGGGGGGSFGGGGASGGW